MNIKVIVVDYSDSRQAKDLVSLLSVYAQDPMGGGKVLDDYVVSNLIDELLHNDMIQKQARFASQISLTQVVLRKSFHNCLLIRAAIWATNSSARANSACISCPSTSTQSA